MITGTNPDFVFLSVLSFFTIVLIIHFSAESTDKIPNMNAARITEPPQIKILCQLEYFIIIVDRRYAHTVPTGKDSAMLSTAF